MALLAVKWFNVSVTGMSSKEVVPVMKQEVIMKQSKLVSLHVTLARDESLSLSFDLSLALLYTALENLFLF